MGSRFILCPEIYKHRWTDFYILLLEKLAEGWGAELRYSTDNLPTDPVFLFLFAVPQWDRPGLFLDYLRKVDKETYIVSYLRDIHSYSNDKFGEEARELFNRFNFIISSCDEYFWKCFPDYKGNFVYMPDFFGPYERYARLDINDKPLPLCLLSGAFNPKVYSIRDYVLKNGNGKRIVHIPPPYPTCPHQFVGDKYAKMLNKFECCVTESGIYPYAITKVFEIPAAGSLLLTNRVKDMDLAGFEPGVHYVEINQENVLETIYKVLDNPGEYRHIKQQGREMVLRAHSMSNRLLFLRQFIHNI